MKSFKSLNRPLLNRTLYNIYTPFQSSSCSTCKYYSQSTESSTISDSSSSTTPKSTPNTTPSPPPNPHQWFSPEPNYPGHVPLNTFQRFLMFASSGIATVINPRNQQLMATFGEMTVQPYFITRLRDQMLQDPTGRRLLREKPRITSKSLNLDYLRSLPSNTFGNVYVTWLDREGVSPDTRLPVRFVDDPECAYVMQRYRECHDFYHAITGLPVLMEGEIPVKAFEYCNLGIPMTGLAAISEPFKHGPKIRKRLRDIYIPWAISNGLRCKLLLNVYWEEELEKDVSQLRSEIGIDIPPDLRTLRKKAKNAKS